jgi:hypothetical protein
LTLPRILSTASAIIVLQLKSAIQLILSSGTDSKGKSHSEIINSTMKMQQSLMKNISLEYASITGTKQHAVSMSDFAVCIISAISFYQKEVKRQFGPSDLPGMI